MAKHATTDESPRQARVSDAPLPTGYTFPVTPDVIATLELTEAHEQMQSTEILRDAGMITEDEAKTRRATATRKVGRALRLLTAGALAVLTVGLVAAGPTSASPAQAAETSTPTAAAGTGVASPVVGVVLNAPTVRVRIPAHTTSTYGGLHCASVYVPSEAGRTWGGSACSALSTFPIMATMDSRFVPLGRSYVAVVDDFDPVATGPQTVALQTRVATRFGRGTWTDRRDGTVGVRVPVQVYSPTAGTWAPAWGTAVRVQERVGGAIGGRWVVAATMIASRSGIATRIVRVGAGLATLRANVAATATRLGTTGATRYVTVTDCARFDTAARLTGRTW